LRYNPNIRAEQNTQRKQRFNGKRDTCYITTRMNEDKIIKVD